MPISSSAVTGSFKPTPVADQNYARVSNVKTSETTQVQSFDTIPEVPSISAPAPKGFFSSTIVRVALAALAFIVIGTSVGVPLGLLLTSTTTSLGTTQTTTSATTTTATTTTATTATTTTTTSATTTTATTTTSRTTSTTSATTTTTTATTTTTSVTTTTTTTTVTTTTTSVTTTTTTTSATTTTTSATTTTTTTSVTTTSTTSTTSITAALTVSGPQLNFNPASLTSAWSVCYSATYATAMFPNITSILASCWKNKLLLGCRPVGNSLLTLAAMGDRSDVLYNTAASSTTTRLGNGVSWYFTMNTGNWNAWGFVMGGDVSNRGNCDGDMTTNPAYRLCWHMIGTSGGWRCGATGGLDTSTSWEKLIYHAM